MFIKLYRDALETKKRNNKIIARNNEIVTYSVYKMDMITTKAQPVSKQYNNWADAMEVAIEMQSINKDKNISYFVDQN